MAFSIFHHLILAMAANAGVFNVLTFMQPSGDDLSRANRMSIQRMHELYVYTQEKHHLFNAARLNARIRDKPPFSVIQVHNAIRRFTTELEAIPEHTMALNATVNVLQGVIKHEFEQPKLLEITISRLKYLTPTTNPGEYPERVMRQALDSLGLLIATRSRYEAVLRKAEQVTTAVRGKIARCTNAMLSAKHLFFGMGKVIERDTGYRYGFQTTLKKRNFSELQQEPAEEEPIEEDEDIPGGAGVQMTSAVKEEEEEEEDE